MTRQKGLTERQYAEQVEGVLDAFGWTWCHMRAARTKHGWRTPLSGYAGMLDYTAVRDGRLLMFEIKTDTGRLTAEQQWWFDELKKCPGVEVYVWQPKMWDVLLETLKRKE